MTQAPATGQADPETSPETELAAALDAMRREAPEHAPLIDAVRPVLLARARLLASLAERKPPKTATAAPDLFVQGAPLLAKGDFLLPRAELDVIRETLLAALGQGFPRLDKELRSLDAAFEAGKLRLAPRLASYLRRGRLPEARVLKANKTSTEAAALYFSQIAKTLAEAGAARLAASPGSTDFSAWKRGYCPVCGGRPEISSLAGKEGRRLLTCSSCATSWPFARTACAFCETDKDKGIELVYLDGKPGERAEACAVCNHYLLAVDRRENAKAPPPRLEPLRLTHLDILMQERGLRPVSVEPGLDR